MRNVALINSLVYPLLLENGGDRLIAFYATLKALKNGKNVIHPITANNGRKVTHFDLLKRLTGFTKKTCIKYFNKLEDLDLCHFTVSGGVHIKGNRKLQRQYENARWVPVYIGKSLINTALNSFSVRVFSAEKKQQIKIAQKQHQVNLIDKVAQGRFVSKKEYDSVNSFISCDKIQKGLDNLCDKVVLSRMGFAKLKDGSTDNVDKGRYWRNRLKSAGKIKTRRNNKPIRKCTILEYRLIKETERNPRLNWYKGMMYEETMSEFTTAKRFPKNEIKKDYRTKPKEYLSFDFIHWITDGRE